MRLTFLPVLALALAGGTWLASSAPAPDSAAVDYSFSEAPLHSRGVKSLSELRGRPVLIEFWGKN